LGTSTPAYFSGELAAMKKVFEHFQSELFLQQCLIFVGAAKPYFRCLSKIKLLVGNKHTSLYFWKLVSMKKVL
jgi:hypothetical protein